MSCTSFQSKLLEKIPNIEYGFGHRQQRCPKKFEKHKELPSFNWKQIHSDKVVNLSTIDHMPGEADGFYTKEKELPLRVITADCTPVLLAQKQGKAIAALHVGWQGALKRILPSFQRTCAQNSLSDWVAVLGPAIKPCCYEFGEDLLKEFRKKFPRLTAQEISPIVGTLDLRKVIVHELQELGIQEIEVCDHCTYCNTSPSYLSHRKRTQQKLDEDNLCQWSTIMIRQKLI